MNCTLDLISIVMLFLQLFAIFIVLNGLKNTERMECALLKYVIDGKLTEKNLLNTESLFQRIHTKN